MRRTRLCFLVAKKDCISLVRLVGEMMGKELGWSRDRIKREIDGSVEKIIGYEFE